MTAQINYTDAQTTQLVQAYQAGTAVEAIAETLGKSVRSVIAKLTREGVYQAKSKKNSTPRLTKEQMVQQIEVLLQAEPGSMKTLEKATYDAVEELFNKVTARTA